MYGYGADEVIGRSVSILVPPNRPDELPELLERLKRGEEVEHLETTRIRKDGVLIDVSMEISAIRDASGEIVGASTIARDITQLKAQVQLERDLADRRSLLAHLVAAGEEERARIANDIHDDSIQAITAAGMRLQIMRKSIDNPEQLSLLDDFERTIQLSIARLRHLLFELRPPVLDNDGLSAALETYLEEGTDGAATTYRLDDHLKTQPTLETRTILYRIVQEALVNTRKHAQAEHVTVSLHERDGGYYVSVSDDGVGFVADVRDPVPRHLGLRAMRERATLAGGWLRIEAVPHKGTTVEVWVPALGGDGREPRVGITSDRNGSPAR
jgi:PAS domain S-box-containing protein